MSNVTEDDPNETKYLQEGPVRWLRKATSGLFGKKDKMKTGHAVLFESFNALWEKTVTFQVFVKKGAKKAALEVAIDENTILLIDGEEVFKINAGQTELTLQSPAETLQEWVACFQQAGAIVPSNQPVDVPAEPAQPVEPSPSKSSGPAQINEAGLLPEAPTISPAVETIPSRDWRAEEDDDKDEQDTSALPDEASLDKGREVNEEVPDNSSEDSESTTPGAEFMRDGAPASDEQSFFAQMKQQQQEREQNKLSRMQPEEKERYLAAQKKKQEHEDHKSKMLKKQMRSYGGGARKSAAIGGRGRGRGRGRGKKS